MHVELTAEDLRTRVQFPPPPPLKLLIYNIFNSCISFAGSQRVFSAVLHQILRPNFLHSFLLHELGLDITFYILQRILINSHAL